TNCLWKTQKYDKDDEEKGRGGGERKERRSRGKKRRRSRSFFPLQGARTPRIRTHES
ncbi:hypothetical protein SK128_023473, partial [Halocaridina rubra]